MAQPVSDNSVPVQAGLVTHWGAQCLEQAGMLPQDAQQLQLLTGNQVLQPVRVRSEIGR